MVITVLQASAAKAAAAEGATLDISGLGTGPFELEIHISAFTANAGVTPQARLVVWSDTVAAHDFSTEKAEVVLPIVGVMSAYEGLRKIFTQRDLPMLPIGIGDGRLKISLSQLVGAGASITYEAFLRS